MSDLIVSSQRLSLAPQTMTEAPGGPVFARDFATRKEYLKAYNHTRSGVLKIIFFSQCQTSRLRGHSPPAYTLQEFRDRFVDDPKYIRLYTAWVESGKQKDLKPSFDRLDESRGYSFDNIQLVTWLQNYQRHVSDVRRTVAVFDGDTLIAIFGSLREAGEAMFNRSRGMARHIDTGRPMKSGHYLYSIPEALIPAGVLCR